MSLHRIISIQTMSIQCHAPLTKHQALRHKLKSCTIPFLYRSDLVKSRRMLYSPDVCNCTMLYVPRTVPAYAIRDPAYTAEVFALTLVKIDVMYMYCMDSLPEERHIRSGSPVCSWFHAQGSFYRPIPPSANSHVLVPQGMSGMTWFTLWE